MINITALMAKVDIVDYVSKFADVVEKRGEFWCCSPLNPNDTDPSFSMSRERQQFYDFSIGKGGDLLNFICLKHKCTVPQAIRILLRDIGITDEELTRYETANIVQVLTSYNRLFADKKGINYKELEPQYLKKYSQDEKYFQSWIEEGIPYELILKYGICYDDWNEAILIPIYDNSGRLVNISNRTTKNNPKVPKYIYSFGWNGGSIDILWGLSFKRESIKQAKQVIIVEGVKSVLKFESYGYNNTVAIMTSHLNHLQLQQLIALQAKEYVFALDTDVKIKRDKTIKLLQQYGRITYIKDKDGILNGKDAPCDRGKELLDKLYRGRFDY